MGQGNAVKSNKSDKGPAMLYSGNVAYLFIPFSCGSADGGKRGEQRCFAAYVQSLADSELWIRQKMRIQYLYRHITEKYDISPQSDSTHVDFSAEGPFTRDQLMALWKRRSASLADGAAPDPEKAQCFHFELNVRAFEKTSQIRFFENYRVSRYKNQMPKGTADFMFAGAELFCFSTLVNILAVKLVFSGNTPIQISNSEFMLKNAERDRILIPPELQPPGATKWKGTSFVKIFKDCVMTAADLTYDFFFYANDGAARANMLTLLEVPARDDYAEELFYLRNCYSDGFEYFREADEDQRIFSSTKGVVWGLSAEAAVCLICPEMQDGSFLKSTFFKNFQAEYLFMYIILLHQKYVLYQFMTDIAVRSSKDVAALESYKDRLYRFETDFVFSRITEVPQYQELYRRLVSVFSLKELYEDVNEPLISLSEVRYKADEEKHQQQDKKINYILFLLSLLSIFSALVDSYDFIEEFLTSHFGLSKTVVQYVQRGIISLIFIAFVVLVLIYFRAFKKSGSSKEGKK